MPTDSLYVLAVLCLIVAASEALVRRTPLRHIGTAVLVILVTAVAANVGVLPAGSTEAAPVPVYDDIFATLAPLSIFWILLRVRLRDVASVGGPGLVLFAAGAAGTALGVIAGMAVLGGPRVFGPLGAAVGGMYAGTYIGGSINFNAVALTYDVVRQGGLYAGAVVVDNVITMVWMAATLAMPRLLAPLWPQRPEAPDTAPPEALAPDLGIESDTEAVHPLDLALVGALGVGALWASNALAAATGAPSILILTVLALVVAQVPAAARLRGAQVLGMVSVYLFLAVIGAFCDLHALADLGRLGGTLLVLAAVIVAVHGVVIVAVGRAMRADRSLVAVASQANVGGSTSALALARSFGRSDLVLPAVLLGSVGNALGTFVGFWLAGVALPALFG